MGVSVIIPTFNSGPLVVEAVRSVLSQTTPVSEVIVVDDGSTDDTAQRMAEFGEPVRYVRQANGGVSTARNRGMAEATHDFVAFLDADDVWHPRKIETQLRAMARNPEFGLIGTNLHDWPGEHPKLPEGEFESPPAPIELKKLIVRNGLVTSTVMARREVLRQVGEFDLELRGPEDHDYWIRAAKCTTVGKIAESLTGYRSSTPGSLSKNAARMETGMAVILQKHDLAGIFNGTPLLRRKAWGYYRYSCGYMRRRSGEHGMAARHLILSLAGYPLPYSREDIRVRCGRARLLVSVVWRGFLGLITGGNTSKSGART